MGETVPAAWLNLVGYWGIGLPLGGWLALERGAGLPGIWWGLCAGLACVATGLMVRLRTRGPGQLTAKRWG
jgi:MATE family multidrug resistance protein